MKKLRVGIIGAGNIACGAHLPAYKLLKDKIEVVAIADIVRERAENAAKSYGIPNVYSSVYELLENCDVDYVDICTWNAGHHECAIAAARAGKHILCEKPMADTLEHALLMQEEIKKAGVKFMLGVVTRFYPEVKLAKEMQEAGEFGEVYFAKTAYTRRRGTPIGWFTDKASSGGGAVIDIGVHCIDRTWYLMGRPKPVSISAVVGNRFGDFKTRGVNRWHGYESNGAFDTDDAGTAFIRFENGACMTAEVAWAQNGLPEQFTVIYGTKAGASFTPDAPLTVYGENKYQYLTDEVLNAGAKSEFRDEIAHFADCIVEDKQPLAPTEDGVTVQRILDAIYRSSEEGREIIL